MSKVKLVEKNRANRFLPLDDAKECIPLFGHSKMSKNAKIRRYANSRKFVFIEREEDVNSRLIIGLLNSIILFLK